MWEDTSMMCAEFSTEKFRTQDIFTHAIQTIERTQISISWSMYKQNMAYVLDQSFNVANLLFNPVLLPGESR